MRLPPPPWRAPLLITLVTPFVSSTLKERIVDPQFLPVFVVLPLAGLALIGLVHVIGRLPVAWHRWPAGQQVPAWPLLSSVDGGSR